MRPTSSDARTSFCSVISSSCRQPRARPRHLPYGPCRGEGIRGVGISSQAPFIVIPYVIDTFEFRVLRQNRRVVKSDDVDRAAELEQFHRVLNDISWGVASDEVRSFIVESYVRGASSNCAEKTPFEGSTGVFTKRRYRDRFNRKMVKRVGEDCGHQLKIKARVRAKGTRGANWHSDMRQM